MYLRKFCKKCKEHITHINDDNIKLVYGCIKCINKKYDNPFKSDVFNNPGYTLEESEKRVSDKIKRIKNLS